MKKFKVEMMVHNSVLNAWSEFFKTSMEKKVGGGMLIGRQFHDVCPLYRVACVTADADTAATPSGVVVTPYWDDSTVMTYKCTEEGIEFLRSCWDSFKAAWRVSNPEGNILNCAARVVITKCKAYEVWGEENALVLAESGDGFKAVGEVLDELADSKAD